MNGTSYEKGPNAYEMNTVRIQFAKHTLYILNMYLSCAQFELKSTMVTPNGAW